MFLLIWATVVLAVRGNNTTTDLSQKPTLMIPPLKAGQQTTLTCTAPGLCSGSDPKITWTWRGAGEKDSHITGNITAFHKENLTAVTQRHSSTLTFNVSAEHHGSEVTCKVSFTGNRTTEETVTLNVTYAKTLEINGNTAVKEGGALNLSCSIESFPPYLITWSKLHSDISLHKETNHSLHSNNGTSNLVILNVTGEDSGQYVCTAIHLNETLTEKVNVTVEYVKKPQIIGNTTVKEGDALNLTCSFDGFSPSVITWTKLGSNKNLKNGTGAATLTIFNVTAEHAGQYICTAKHLNTTLTTYANVTVALCPTILNSSGCMRESEVLTCVCVSEGSPLPTIKWPLLENHTEYTVITTVSNHTVNSTIILTIKDHRNTDVKCVSDNKNGKLNVTLIIKNVEEEKEDQSMKILRAVTRLEMIIAFLIGGLLSSILCCLGRQCCRKKQRTSRKLDETLEMVISQEGPLIDAGPAVEDDLIHNREGAEGGRALEAEKSDLEYSDIDFSVLKRKNLAKAGNSRVNTDTEYAEIKKEAVEERQDEEEIQEDTMMGDNGEAIQCMQEETEGEDVALYSNVKDIMG